MIKTMLLELYKMRYRNLSELAEVMGISASQVYRARQGKSHINEKFIIGVIRAFPEYRFSDLFYLVPESESAIWARS